MNILHEFTKNQHSQTLMDIRPGDTIKIFQKVKEGEKTRVQPFEGLVIARKHGRGISATITVRKISGGIGVEKIIPIHSPTITKVEVLKRSKVRRAKLYYIRTKAAREVRRKMKTLAHTKTPTPEGSRQAETKAADAAKEPEGLEAQETK